MAEIRGVPHSDAARGTGYGELFEAILLLCQNRPHDAFDVLTAEGNRGLYGRVFHQWTATLAAEAAIRSGRADAQQWTDCVTVCSAGNPISAAIMALLQQWAGLPTSQGVFQELISVRPPTEMILVWAVVI